MLFGLLLAGVAFSAAAFTAKETVLANHYIQKPGECKAIPVTNCIPNNQVACFASDAGVGSFRVYQVQLNDEECDVPLFLP